MRETKTTTQEPESEFTDELYRLYMSLRQASAFASRIAGEMMDVKITPRVAGLLVRCMEQADAIHTMLKIEGGKQCVGPRE